MPEATSKLTALLPMKGHSERVPNKNLRDFYGRPLYHAIMHALLPSQYISKVVINTDSQRIKDDVTLFFPARVAIHDRPGNICGDFVPMNDIIRYDIECLPGDHFLQTHSTNPLLTTAIIDSAIQQYFKAILEGYDSLFSVTRLQTRLYDQHCRPLNHNPKQLLRTQDLPPVYEENSCLYLFSRQSFCETDMRIGRKPYLFLISREEAWDIDDELDFRVAEYLWQTRNGC